MDALITSPVAAQAAVIGVSALLGWIACLRARVYRQWMGQPDRAERLAALPAQWCVSLSTVAGCL